MKLLFVLNQFLPRHIAGTEMYCYWLGKELTEFENEVIYIIPGYSKNKTEEYIYNGLRVIEFAEPSIVDRKLKMGLRPPDGLQNFIEVLANEKPDLVHFHELAGSNGISLYHVEAAKKAGAKLVMTFHVSKYITATDNQSKFVTVFDNFRASMDFYIAKGMSRFVAMVLYYPSLLLKICRIETTWLGKFGTALAISRLVEKRRLDFLTLIGLCDKVITVAKWFNKILIEIGVDKEKLEFIEQGISLSHMPKTVQPRLGDGLNVIFVGRISHSKGVKLLIQAASELDHFKLQLDIFGDSGEDDTYIEECKKMAEKLDNVYLKGRLSPSETLAIMSRYDVLVLPSSVPEMSPLVIREAFAAGIPVLASDSPGAAEQIRDRENGWLFRMNDVGDLKMKLQYLMDNPQEIDEAKKHLPKTRSMREVAEEHQLLYLSLLSNHKTGVN